MRGAIVTFENVVILVVSGIFIIGLGAVHLTTTGEPTVGIYGAKQAHMQAQSLSISINAMATVESGTMKRFLSGEWDVEIKDGKVSFSSGEYKGSEELMVKVDDVRMEGVRQIEIVKEEGKPVKVRRWSP